MSVWSDHSPKQIRTGNRVYVVVQDNDRKINSFGFGDLIHLDNIH